MSFLLTLDGSDLTGKTTIAEELQKMYEFARVPKVTDMGLIPKDIEERLHWYYKTPMPIIAQKILESDILRRQTIASPRVVIERGRITVVSTCIAKAMMKDKLSYEAAKTLVLEAMKSCKYNPTENLRIYLRVDKLQLHILEQRSLQREGKPFDSYEQEYYSVLIHAIEEQTKLFPNLIVNPFESLESKIREIMEHVN